jgi:hypothetical protein
MRDEMPQILKLSSFLGPSPLLSPSLHPSLSLQSAISLLPPLPLLFLPSSMVQPAPIHRWSWH